MENVWVFPVSLTGVTYLLNYLSNLKSDPGEYIEKKTVKTCLKIFRNEGIQNFILEPLQCPNTEAWSRFSIQM